MSEEQKEGQKKEPGGEGSAGKGASERSGTRSQSRRTKGASQTRAGDEARNRDPYSSGRRVWPD